MPKSLSGVADVSTLTGKVILSCSKRMYRLYVCVVGAALFAPLAACSGSGGSLPALRGESALTLPVADRINIATSSSTSTRDASAQSVITTDVDSQTAMTGEMALSADSLPGDHDVANNFIDSVGVNTKFNAYGSDPYANYGAIKSALMGLGVRHVRDELSTQNLNNYENKLKDLALNNIHSELGLTLSEDGKNVARINVSGKDAVAYLQAGHYVQSIEAIEGINEPDINQVNPTGPIPVGWLPITQTEQKNLYAGVQTLRSPAKRIPVYGPSIGRIADLALVGNLSPYMDYGNVHDYSGGYDLTPATIHSVLASAATVSGTRPIVATENGYSTGTTGQGMPDGIMLDYCQRLFFKQFANNIKRTMWYQFVDQTTTPNDYWKNSGLITASYRPKLAYTGLKNIMALLKDQTPYKQRTALNVSFGGQAQFENLNHLLLQKNDGTFWLVVWSDVSEWSPANNGSPGSYPQPAPATYANTINILGTYVSSMTEYGEDWTGTMLSKPIAVHGGSAQITVGVRPVIFKIVPGTAPVLPPAPTLPDTAAHWSLDEGSGTVAADSSNSSGNFTVPVAGREIGWLSGRYKAGLSFNGTQASTNHMSIDTYHSYSATAWVQMNSLNGFQAAVALNGINQAAFALDFTPQTNLSYTTYASDAVSGGTRIGSHITPVIGQWYAVAATFNGMTRKMSFYINGALQGTATAPRVFTANGDTEIGSMRAAGVGHYQWWSGGIDEVNLYQRELSAADVRLLAGK